VWPDLVDPLARHVFAEVAPAVTWRCQPTSPSQQQATPTRTRTTGAHPLVRAAGNGQFGTGERTGHSAPRGHAFVVHGESGVASRNGIQRQPDSANAMATTTMVNFALDIRTLSFSGSRSTADLELVPASSQPSTAVPGEAPGADVVGTCLPVTNPPAGDRVEPAMMLGVAPQAVQRANAVRRNWLPCATIPRAAGAPAMGLSRAKS
jgi:hypothetical protein